MVSAPAVDYAVFTAESLKADSSMIIDAGRDVSLSGLVTAKNASGNGWLDHHRCGSGFPDEREPSRKALRPSRWPPSQV
jgi:hypothetical protein